MAKQNADTASFLVRFTQKIYDDEGTSNVQWRGKISHVQGGDATAFTDVADVIEFMQEKLSDLTKQSVEDKTPEEQDGILNRSLDIWKRFSAQAPKMVMDTIKDPKKQVATIQDQLTQVGDELGQKLEQDTRKWRAASKSDIEEVQQAIADLASQISFLASEVGEIKSTK